MESNLKLRAYTMINCALNREKDVIKNIKEYAEKSKDVGVEMTETFGTYDIVAKISSTETDKAKEFISKGIRKTKYVKDTLTIMVIDSSYVG